MFVNRINSFPSIVDRIIKFSLRFSFSASYFNYSSVFIRSSILSFKISHNWSFSSNYRRTYRINRRYIANRIKLHRLYALPFFLSRHRRIKVSLDKRRIVEYSNVRYIHLINLFIQIYWYLDSICHQRYLQLHDSRNKIPTYNKA